MDKITAQTLLKIWTGRRDALTPQLGRAQLAKTVQAAKVAYMRGQYTTVGKLLDPDKSFC